MLYVRSICAVALMVLLLTLPMIATGCPSGQKPDTNDSAPAVVDDSSEDTGDDTSEAADSGSTEQAGEPIQVSGGGTFEIEDLIGNRRDLTQQDVEGLNSYGVILHPKAKLLETGSMHQEFGEGTEIYRFGLEIPVNVTEAAKWYRENLESGFKEENMELSTGGLMTGFESNAADSTWNKKISLNGFPKENRTQVTVYIQAMTGVPKTDKDN